MIDTRSTLYKAGLVADFIARHAAARTNSSRPLLVSMQGPQGAGKSTLAAALIDTLAKEHGLRCGVASLDDFYLPYHGLKSLAKAHPDNKMLQGRGPPGTHDIPLLTSVLQRLRDGPAPAEWSPLDLPSFDKSQHNGFGDRSAEPIRIRWPVDVFLLEGWSLGYMSISDQDVQAGRSNGRTAQAHSLSSLAQINDNLAAFDSATSPFFDCHVAIRPQSYDYVYTWRTEQEHMMKERNGGRGMSDTKVTAFVDRYMPVYEVFGQTGPARPTLLLKFGETREVLQA